MPTQVHDATRTIRLGEETPQPDPIRPEPERRRKRRPNDPAKPEPHRDKPGPENPHDPQDLPSQELSSPGRN